MAFLKRILACLQLAQLGSALRTGLSIAELQQQIRTPDHYVQGSTRDSDDLRRRFPEHNLTVPIDHFHNDSLYEPHSHDTFQLRYWFDASYYRKGGPVFVLAAGETDGEGRLPFLQKGIIHQFAQMSGGIAVVLEHRYYGKSFPVANLSTESLRFLTTDQALADTAYFAKNVVFEGLEDLDLTAPETAYIAYGGSYAGAFVAFLRKLYPDLFWGAISSSGVTEAIYDYWQYYEAARLYAPAECVKATQELTHVADTILINNTKYTQELKDVFGLGNLTHDQDFAQVLSFGITQLQDTNWDPKVSSPLFSYYCGNMSSKSVLYPDTTPLTPTVRSLLAAGGYAEHIDRLQNRMLNFIGFLNATALKHCHDKPSWSHDQCFSNYNSTFYAQDDITQQWRAWPYQYCQQWGYLQTGSGVPSDQLPLVSRLIDIEYGSIICREAFNITTPPDLDAINKHGGLDFSYPRVAIVDGEADPWRAATPHAIVGARDRNSTVSEPFILIGGAAVHHWDENGLLPEEVKPGYLPPSPVATAQQLEREFVSEWLKEWQQHKQESQAQPDIEEL
ncbi:serine carboxypeptidase S28-domain-containing protein [Xylariales sp. PMI_506]|nr:serine carboxypeptidase S28-domain-containing protein [Xylariales sp. PMI_506]